MICGTILQEDLPILNVAPNIRASKYLRKNQNRKERDKFTVIVGNVNTSLSIIHRLKKQEICKDMDNLKNTINKTYLADVYRPLHPATAEYIL